MASLAPSLLEVTIETHLRQRFGMHGRSRAAVGAAMEAVRLVNHGRPEVLIRAKPIAVTAGQTVIALRLESFLTPEGQRALREG
jgi:hypothetical protein